jgi:outer membrane phospholipase A
MLKTTAAAEVSHLASFPTHAPIAGSATVLRIYFHNEGTTSETVIIPAQIQIHMQDESAKKQIISAFNKVGDTLATLAPGHFISHDYALTLPTTLAGTISYDIAEFSDVRETTKIIQGTAESSDKNQIFYGETKRTRSITEIDSLYSVYAANFAMHEPIYFLIGSNPEDSTFQLSFRYRLFNPSGTLSIKHPWLSGFNLAYTQTSFWDLKSDSFPFEDTSYKPEFMYLTENLKLRPSWLDGLFLQTAIQHESNGRDGDESRSTNYVYVKPSFIFYHEASQLGIMFSPKFLYYFNNDDETNPGLENYRGHIDLELKVGKANSYVLTTNTRFASKGTSFQADLTYPLSRLLNNNFDIYLQLRYSNILAESLLDYTERTETLRLGIALTR